MMDPIHQFNIDKIFTIGHIGGQEIAFTNSTAYMLVTVVLTALLMLATGRHEQGVLDFYGRAGFARGTKTFFEARRA